MGTFDSEILKYQPSQAQIDGIAKLEAENAKCWDRVEARYEKKRLEAEKLKKKRK